MFVVTAKQLSILFEITEKYVRETFKEYKQGLHYEFIPCVKKMFSQTKGDTGTKVSQKTMAEIISVTEKTVRSLTENQILIKDEKDRYDLITNVKRYIDNNDERNKYQKAKREMQEFKLDIFQDKYHKSEDIEILWSNLILNCKSKLTSAARKIFNDIKNIPENEMLDIIERHLQETLEEMSDFKLPSNKEKIEKEMEKI